LLFGITCWGEMGPHRNAHSIIISDTLTQTGFTFQQLMTHFLIRTQLGRVTPLIHRPTHNLATSIFCFQTLSLPQFSTKTSALAGRRSHSPLRPAMEAKPPESAASGEDFVHVADLKMESLSESMVRIDEPSNADAAPSAPDDTPDSDRLPVTLPEELSRNVLVLSCESAAEGGVCDVYLVGTAHVSEVLVLVVQNQVLGFVMLHIVTMFNENE